MNDHLTGHEITALMDSVRLDADETLASLRTSVESILGVIRAYHHDGPSAAYTIDTIEGIASSMLALFDSDETTA